MEISCLSPALVNGLLAATAQEHGLVLVTRHTRDVAPRGVATLNPFEKATRPDLQGMGSIDMDVAHHPGRDAQDAPPVAAPAIVLVRDGDEVSLLADEQPAGVAQILFVVHLLVLHPASIVVGIDPRDLDPLQPLSRRRTKTRRGRLQPESWRVSSRPCHPWPALSQSGWAKKRVARRRTFFVSHNFVRYR